MNLLLKLKWMLLLLSYPPLMQKLTLQLLNYPLLKLKWMPLLLSYPPLMQKLTLP